MNKALIIVLFLCVHITHAQDKLFFKNNTSRKGIILSVTKDYILFKSSDTSNLEKIKTSDLILMEDYRGTRYLFGKQDKNAVTEQHNNSVSKRNSIGVQPLSIFFGRATFVYERLSKDGKIGFALPLIVTFSPNYLNPDDADSSQINQPSAGLNFISGLDLNFYFGNGGKFSYFAGPRLRYGTDVALSNIEGITLQTQLGIKIQPTNKKIVQHLAIGYGFARILSSPLAPAITSRQNYPWCSVTYRISFMW